MLETKIYCQDFTANPVVRTQDFHCPLGAESQSLVMKLRSYKLCGMLRPPPLPGENSLSISSQILKSA